MYKRQAKNRFNTLDSLHDSSIMGDEGSLKDKYQVSIHSSGSNLVREFIESGNDLVSLFPKLNLNSEQNAQKLVGNVEIKDKFPFDPALVEPPKAPLNVYTASPAKFVIKAQGNPVAAFSSAHKKEADIRAGLNTGKKSSRQQGFTYQSQATTGGNLPNPLGD